MAAGAVLVFGCQHAWSDHSKTVFGVPDCSQWLNEPTFARQSWLMGFLSGYNIGWTAGTLLVDDPLDRLAAEDDAYAWMDQWCKANPLKNVGHGAQHLYLQLARPKAAGQ